MSLLTPKSDAEKGLHILMAVGLVSAATWYLLSTFDLIPDAGIVGFLDDAIIILLAVYSVNQVLRRTTGRAKATYSTVSGYFQNHSLFDLLVSGKFWFTVILLAVSISYFQWTLDFIPDSVTGFGYLDDVVVIFGNLTALLRFYQKRKK